MLTISDLTYRIAGRLIFEDASASIMDNWKVGVIGANGAGKSTLFKLITKELQNDGGTIEMSNRQTLGMIRQDLPDGEISLLDVVLSADVERTELLARSETEQDPYQIAEIYARLSDIDAYTAPARASAILTGMGFKEEQLTAPMSSLSGGWRMRVALGAALFQEPDILLLDEPTNHLDLEAIMWLEDYLVTYPHTLVLISHDRELLNKCTDHIVHVENKKLEVYTGNYDSFERERAEKRGLQQKMFEKQQTQRAHLQKFVDRFAAKASKAKQAQSRVKALEKMDMVSAVMAERSTSLIFPQPEELPPPLMSISGVDLGYDDNPPVLKGVDERIDMDDRIALLGANGNGKSTLLSFIAGRLAPLAGTLNYPSKLRIGYFSQHQTDEMDVNSTPFEQMLLVMKGDKKSDPRSKLGRFGFNKHLQDTLISDLSGGEKARLLFAMISHDAPHMLLLDEPTNHLDIDAREALVQALTTYEGAVVLVSHDPSMVERVADRLWLVKDGGVKPFDGDLDAYRKLVVETRKQEKREEKLALKEDESVKEKPLSNKEKKQLEARKRKQFPDLYKAVTAAEKEYKATNRAKKEIELKMQADGFYDDSKLVQSVQQELALATKELEVAEITWLEAQEVYEAAGA